MQSKEIEIINQLGLHARAAAKFVGAAGRFDCSIKVGRTVDSLVDGKSIMSVMMLAASKGTKLQLITDGNDEEKALNTIIELVENYFGEGK